jgi:hypothetical protein
MQELTRARALVHETGAKLFENFINQADVEHIDGRQTSMMTSREDRIA